MKKKILGIFLIIAIAISSIATAMILLIKSPTLGKMNISDAEYLFIAPGSAKRLYMVTDNNSIVQVSYQDTNGNPMTMAQEPIAIYNVDANYVIICYGLDAANIVEGYLVRKSDGAVFSLANAGYPLRQPNLFKNDKTVYNDSNSNIYYLAKAQELGPSGALNTELVKLNTQNVSSITKVTFSPGDEHVEGFIVDNDGNAPYYGRQKTEMSGTRSIYRIMKANGGLYNLPSGTTNFWVGLDGVGYFLNSSGKIQKMSINSSYSVELKAYGTGAYSPFTFSNSQCYYLALKDRILIVDTSQGKIFEVYNPSDLPREINLAGSPISTIKQAIASEEYYYLSGTDSGSNPVLIQVNATDDSWSSLYTAGTYDIYTMSVSNADMLLFNALRMSDGIKVIGNINATHSPAVLSILDEVSNKQMTVLERIA